MNIEHRQQDGITVVTIRGRLDGNTSSQMEAEFLRLAERGESRFVFHLAELDYVSSAGLRCLLLAAKKVKAMQGKLALAHMSEHVREVFDMSGFSSIFTICATETEAVRAVG